MDVDHERYNKKSYRVALWKMFDSVSFEDISAFDARIVTIIIIYYYISFYLSFMSPLMLWKSTSKWLDYPFNSNSVSLFSMLTHILYLPKIIKSTKSTSVFMFVF